jgi:glutamate 5-kinase
VSWLRLVAKVGTSSLGGLSQASDTIRHLADQVAVLVREGWEVAVVTSGAVRLGREMAGTHLDRAAAAAIGQPWLMERWSQALGERGLLCAQVLLTDGELMQAATTVHSLLREGVVPVVNGNDAAADMEQVSDNDTLAARLAVEIEAQCLVLLTDQEGVLSEDPRVRRSAVVLPRLTAAEALRRFAGPAPMWVGAHGRGGMPAKVRAAAYAARCGVRSVIAKATAREVLVRTARGARVGTEITAEGGEVSDVPAGLRTALA